MKARNMRYRITTNNNDGLAEAPSVEIDADEDVLDMIDDELSEGLPVGGTILVERIN